MIVLALDQAPSGTGWAWGTASSSPNQGYKQFPDYGNNESALFGYVFKWLRNFAKSIGAEAIYTEQIIIVPKHFHAPTVAKQYAVFAAALAACSEEFLNIPHYEAEVSTWRHACGILGPDWKQAAIRWATSRGFYTDNHHVAEAIGILHHGLCEHDREYRLRSQAELRRARELKAREGAML
jgi:hypothetical protein